MGIINSPRSFPSIYSIYIVCTLSLSLSLNDGLAILSFLDVIDRSSAFVINIIIKVVFCNLFPSLHSRANKLGEKRIKMCNEVCELSKK